MDSWQDCLVDTDVATIKCFEPVFYRLAYTVIALVGVAFFFMMIIGGYTFLFSQGDPKKLEQAKGTLTKAVIGVVIIASAVLILRVIAEITGVEGILKFSVWQIP